MSAREEDATSADPDSAKQKQLKYLGNIIRALVTSRKPPCTIRNIMHDYPQVEGQDLPYQSMGYKTAEELLAATGEFFFKRVGNDVIITTKFSSKSAHIQNMVNKQKDSKVKNRSRPKRTNPKPRQPSRSKFIVGGGKPIDIGDAKSIATHSFAVDNGGVTMLNVGKTNGKIKPTNAANQNNYKDDINNNNNNNNNSKSMQKVRPILGQNNNNTTIAYETVVDQRQMAKVAQQKQNVEFFRKLNMSSGSISKGTGKISIQDRLRLKIDKDDKQHNGDKIITIDLTSPTSPTTPDSITETISSTTNTTTKITTTSSKKLEFSNDIKNVCPPKVFQFDKDIDPRKSLEQYCVARGYEPPEFSVVESKFTRKVFGRVIINDKVYTTYPDEATNSQNAIEMSAKKAIEVIELNETRQTKLPDWKGSDDELIDIIYEKLLTHPHGLFARSLPECFEEEYKKKIPENWWTLVQTSNKFLTEKAVSNENVIVFANRNAKDDIVASVNSLADDKIPSIQLPWWEKFWYLTISSCVSTTTIYARLIGTDYSESFDMLMNAVDQYMLENKKRPLSIALNKHYLVSIYDFWHRIRVIEMDKTSETVLIFFIDVGETEWFPVTNLYVCESRFLSLPAQAVCFSLYGLEDFASFPNARRVLDEFILSKSLVTDNLTKETDYDVDDQKKIITVLYDTSTEEDINLNELLRTEICKNISKPKIDADIVQKIIIRNINDNGDITVNLLDGDIANVNKLIEQLISTKFKKDQFLVKPVDIKKSDLFLVFDDSKALQPSTWQRATIIDKEEKGNIFTMYFVDEGGIHSVHISNIFRLESLSSALSKYPHQAIVVRLDNIPAINAYILGRMRALLPIDKEALIKVSKDDKVIPLVYIYRRADENSTLSTINDVIRLEYDLEHKDDKKLSKTTLSDRLLQRSLTSPTRTIVTKLNTMSIDAPAQKLPNLPKLENYTNFPKINEYIDVRIVMSANPTNFKLQCFNECKRLDALMIQLQEHCKNSCQELIPYDLIEVGQAYAAKNPDGYYHRAIIEKITDVGKMVCVYYCDYGDMAIVLNKDLKTLPVSFRELPKMAIQSKLFGISAMNGDWTKDDCIRFRELTVGKKFVAQIKKISTDGPRRTDHVLEVDLVDVSTDDDIYIKQILIDEKRAVDTVKT